MIFGAVGWLLRDGHWMKEGGRKTNDIGKPRLTKVEQHNLIGAPGYHQVSAIHYQHTNELMNSDSFRF
jgi:hypothetical protein